MKCLCAVLKVHRNRKYERRNPSDRVPFFRYIIYTIYTITSYFTIYAIASYFSMIYIYNNEGIILITIVELRSATTKMVEERMRNTKNN